MPPAIQLLLRDAVVARDFVLQLLACAFHTDLQATVFFVAKTDIDRRLCGQTGR
jgi:hypothetical protein